MQDKQIEDLEAKLESRYQEIFHYRLETQKTQQENKTLKLKFESTLKIEQTQSSEAKEASNTEPNLKTKPDLDVK